MTTLLTPTDNREAWLAARRRGIGASEIAAVLGISPWESPFSLYWRKVNGWEFEPSAEMEWGTRLEDAIAAKYDDNHPADYIERAGLEIGPEPWMLATPDRLLYSGSDLIAVLELKTAHSAAEGWGEPGTADIPVHYRAQVQWQMLCCELDDAMVAVLIGGSDYREYHVRRDERDIAAMVEAGRRFMHRLETGDPPPLDEHAATLATIKRLHPDLVDESAEVPPPVAAGYLRAVAMLRKAETLKQRYEIALRDAMGSAHRASCGGRKVATHVITDVPAEKTPRGPVHKDYLLPPKEARP